jgi:adenylate cyclase
MAEERVQRKLAAILAADVVGYSRLMETDEAGTLNRLKALRRDLFVPTTERFGGRIFKVTGDGALAEFPSAVDALNSAVSVQRALADRNARLPENQRIELRVGISLGDVIVEGDDLYGRGVNIAARMEGLAEPGGICISGNVHEHVRGTTGLVFNDLGKREVKNIADPVHAYCVQLGSDAVSEPDQQQRDASLPLPDKPSIAILPFDNLSGDPDQRYFADGIVEDIITELSNYTWLLVIARNTSFTFRDKVVDIKEVGRKLRVRYVMEGSIRRTGDRVRITAQLIDAQSGAHVWAEHFDRDLADVFAVQDEITQNVAGAIQPRLISAEAERARTKPPESMVAWDYAVRGRWHVLRLTKEHNAEAQRLLREGLELYPNSAPILTFLSYSLTTGVIFGWSTDPQAWLTEARGLAERAANLDENDAWVQCVLGLGQFTAKQPDKAIGHYKKAIALNPSFALGHGYLALQLAFLAGRTDEAIKEAETAIRLSPRDPELYHFFYAIGMAHFVAERYDQAATWGEKAENERPAGIGLGPLRLLASTYAHLDRLDEARDAFASVLEVTPRISATGIRNAIHFGRPKDLERYLEGLRKAGLPE